MNNKAIIHNNADGTEADNSVDENPTKNPNDYLAPRVDSVNILYLLAIVALVLLCGYLSVSIAKQSKFLSQ